MKNSSPFSMFWSRFSFFTRLLFLIGAIFLSCASVFAAVNPFSDITEKDDIYSSLMTLYKKEIISVPQDGKFHPEALMNRDEFVSIVVGVGCKKCLTPSAEDVIKYTTAPFVDFSIKSPYFYCVSYAKEKGIIEWYKVDGGVSTCQNGKKYNETPFCAENRITRIEAAAVLLRQAGLWSESLNSSNYTHTKEISDTDAYWYGYAQKALDAWVILYKEGTKIYPNEYITKREFVKMAERFFTINLCELKDGGNSDFASDIHVVDKTSACSVNSPATTFSNASENTYSFIPEVSTTASGYTYEWEFVNSDTKEKKTETSQNLCSYALPSSGIWIVKLTVRDKNGNTSISYSQVSVTSSSASKTPLSVDISAKPLVSPIGIAVGFDSKISGGVGPYEYRWSFGDGDLAKTSTSTHTYSEKGVYTVTLVVTDSQGNHAYSSLNVEVYENADIDGDGILNNEDLCPTVYGIKELAGCPRVDEFSVDTPGSSFLSANAIGNVCLSSLAFDSGALFGKSACTSCPCEYSLDFNAALRRCDIVFPTILSPDKKTIYSRGKIYEIPAK